MASLYLPSLERQRLKLEMSVNQRKVIKWAQSTSFQLYMQRTKCYNIDIICLLKKNNFYVKEKKSLDAYVTPKKLATKNLHSHCGLCFLLIPRTIGKFYIAWGPDMSLEPYSWRVGELWKWVLWFFGYEPSPFLHIHWVLLRNCIVLAVSWVFSIFSTGLWGASCMCW